MGKVVPIASTENGCAVLQDGRAVIGLALKGAEVESQDKDDIASVNTAIARICSELSSSYRSRT